MAFKDNLAALPEPHGSLIRLFDEKGREVAAIENVLPTVGSYRVYAWLLDKYGKINTAAAIEGLAVYAEYSVDAQRNPGKHPNIDRLFDVIRDNRNYLYVSTEPDLE